MKMTETQRGLAKYFARYNYYIRARRIYESMV